MISNEYLTELNKLESKKTIVIKQYEITVRMMNLRLITKYSNQLKSTTKSTENILENLSALVNECSTIVDKDEALDAKNPVHTKLKLEDLEFPIALAVVEEWTNLNFTMREKMIELIDRVLSTIVGKPVNLQSVLSTLSSLLSVQAIVQEQKSGT